MRILIAIGVLLLAGMVGLIVQHGTPKPAARSPASDHAGAKIATISRGEAVDLAGHVAGPRTVVEFTADW